ncbi:MULTISPECIES: hypothetical protein [unclassified Pseudoclavibacter]|uniref:hypothetical protein n=1 Tax=unclassified Pseudoclavibacter TaxID=2615177 RepID=UPI0017887C12|nr:MULTISPECIES: hypothetical protein [unclassified Pseudoclavibacter]
MTSTDRQSDDQARYIEVWNDLVSPRDLTWALLICGGTTAAALLIATLLSFNVFFWGLGGSVIGFVISTFVFTPKRDVRIVSADDGLEHSIHIRAEADVAADTDKAGDR